MLDAVFDRFVEKSPVSVMARGLLERTLNPEQLDAWFEQTADRQYTETLLFSSVFALMHDVICGVYPAVNAAYQASELGVSVQALYQKLNKLEITTSAALVRYVADAMTPIIQELGGTQPPRLPGYRVKILDGNCLAASEHRLEPLRDLAAGALPGKTLVVYDPELRLPLDVFPCEDGHAQERSLLADVLATVKAGDVWIADRNFCTRAFLGEIDDTQAYFIIRQHGNLPWTSAGKERYVGRTDTGAVYDQPIVVKDEQGNAHQFRRIRVCLDRKTRDEHFELAIITNLPQDVVDAPTIAHLYRGRWTIETAFQELTEHLHSELNTLGYPPAALFGFCIALVAYMVMKVIRAALGAEHGVEKIETEVSDYYISLELSNTYEGMMIAIPREEWTIFRQMTRPEFVDELKRLASKARLARYRKHSRGPKKPPPRKKKDPKTPHVSTARLLAKRKKEESTFVKT
jgi:IS4 transposase